MVATSRSWGLDLRERRSNEAPSGDRTHDRTLTERMLCQLSYRGHGWTEGVLVSAFVAPPPPPAVPLRTTAGRGNHWCGGACHAACVSFSCVSPVIRRVFAVPWPRDSLACASLSTSTSCSARLGILRLTCQGNLPRLAASATGGRRNDASDQLSDKTVSRPPAWLDPAVSLARNAELTRAGRCRPNRLGVLVGLIKICIYAHICILLGFASRASARRRGCCCSNLWALEPIAGLAGLRSCVASWVLLFLLTGLCAMWSLILLLARAAATPIMPGHTFGE